MFETWFHEMRAAIPHMAWYERIAWRMILFTPALYIYITNRINEARQAGQINQYCANDQLFETYAIDDQANLITIKSTPETRQTIENENMACFDNVEEIVYTAPRDDNNN